ncbi:MAG: deoxyribonuclease IV [Actinomycetota bacterium]|nr:deoxyribonuclease IV [Actinomycetota bacterium]
MLLGAHVSSAGGIDTAIDRAERLGAEAVQLFTQSPRTWRPTNHDPADLARFSERREEAGVAYVLCHALYLINLASPDDDIYEKSVAALTNTVDVAAEIDADVVFHVGSHRGGGLDQGLARVLQGLERALARGRERTWILLENSAGAGGTIGRSIAELAVVVDRLERHPRLGVCLDSCHLWVSGIDVSEEAALDAVLLDLEDAIGLDRLRALHVNDAKDGLGSNRDRHANIGKGKIGERLAVFLAHPKLQALPAVLETPGKDGKGPDAEEMRNLRKLYEGAVKRGRRRRSAR